MTATKCVQISVVSGVFPTPPPPPSMLSTWFPITTNQNGQSEMAIGHILGDIEEVL